MKMFEQKLMALILGKEQDDKRKSSFIMALRSARFLVGKNPDRNESDFGDLEMDLLKHDVVGENKILNEMILTGVVMHLMLLDLVGSLFKRSDSLEDSGRNHIIHALTDFSDVDIEYKDSVRCLRNTLAHNFSLATMPSKNEKLIRKFILDFSSYGPWIKNAVQPWTGDYADKKEDTSTIINVNGICNMVENVINEVYKAYDEGKLRFRPDNLEEIESRFTLLI